MDQLTQEQRQQILKDDQPWIGRPLEPANINFGLQANTRYLTRMLLDTAQEKRATRAMEFMAQLMDATAAAQIKGPIACAKGCFHCCTTYVSATIPEILRLADAVRGNPDAVKRVMTSVVPARAVPQAEREAQRVYCPMLENLGCGQYASRPIVCRSLLSKSLDPCIRIFTQNIPDAFLHADNSVDVRTYIVIILQASLTLAGLSHFHYELIQGLAAALAHEDAEARWLAGEPVFASVPVDSGETRQGKLWGLVNKVVSVVRPTL